MELPSLHATLPPAAQSWRPPAQCLQQLQLLREILDQRPRAFRAFQSQGSTDTGNVEWGTHKEMAMPWCRLHFTDGEGISLPSSSSRLADNLGTEQQSKEP